MAVDPWQLRPKQRATMTQTFTDTEQGATLTLTLRALNAVDSAAMQDRTDALVKRHIDEQVPFPPVGGQSVEVGPTLFRAAAMLEAMQPPDVGERYTAEDFVALAFGLSSETWVAIQQFAGRVNQADAKNDSGPVANS